MTSDMPANEDPARLSSVSSSFIQEVLPQGTGRIKSEKLILYLFEVYQERVSGLLLFGGAGFQKYLMVIQQIPQWNLWQVQIIKGDTYELESVFLLESVE